MTFKNIQFKCIKGIPINSVETRMLGEIGFPVDVPTQPDMSHSIAFYNYVSKISEYPFPLLRFVEKYYIKSLIETKSKDEAFKTTLDYLKLTNVVSEELEAALQSSCIFGLNALDAETLIKDTISSIPHNTYNTIELVLFSLSKQFYYTRTEDTAQYAADFVVYKDGEKILKCLILLFVALFLFPIIIGGIYALPLPQVIAVESGDLLAYYATAFGIIGSFITYRHETNKNKKEIIKEIKPTFVVEVDKVDEESDVFRVNIINRSQQAVTFLHFYDEFISTIVSDKYSLKTTFNKSIEEIESIYIDHNITMDSEIIDADGFPKYVQLLCDDSDGNSWNCCYYKVKDCDKTYYYPRDFEII